MRRFENKAFNKGAHHIAGIDEAGRGPLAGPVISAAVVLPRDFFHPDIIDSKKLSPVRRHKRFDLIQNYALDIGIGACSPAEIDEINIHKASLLSMLRAVEKLNTQPDFLLIDGKFTLQTLIAQQAIIKGEIHSISIAAASIIAKVTRDRIMAQIHEQYPAYGFDRHKGYPTRFHKQAVIDFGPSPVHRKTFKGVKEVIFQDAS